MVLIKRFLFLFSLIFMVFPPTVLPASLQWTCPKCGQTFYFDPRDSAYRDSFAQRHMAAHGSSAGQSGSYSGPSGNIDLMQQFISGFQQGLEQQRQQQLQQQGLMREQMMQRQKMQEEQERIRRQNEQQKQKQFEADRDDLLNQLSGSGNETLQPRDVSAPVPEKPEKAGGLFSFQKTKSADISMAFKSPSLLESGYFLKSSGYPIVSYDKLGLLDPADLKAFIAGLSKEDLNKLDQYLKQKKERLSNAIEQIKDRETRALLVGYSAPDYQLWTQAVKDKIMDDIPLARTMETLGQNSAGADVEINTADFNYKTYADTEKLAGKLTEGKGIAEVEAAMAYKKFTEADNFKDGAIAALPYTGEAIKKIMPEPSDLAKYGQRTVKIAEKGSTVIDAMEQISDIGYRGMDMHIFNEGIRQTKTSNKALAIELRSQRENFTGRVNEIKQQEKLIKEELSRR